jgi:imidazolonepropionase-like amidohydrolase
MRAVLRHPLGDPVVRDVVDGRWADPTGDHEEIVGEGQWAIPGLVDAHAHLAAADLVYAPGDIDGAVARAKESLAAGVTLLFDKGWADDTTIRVIDTVEPARRPDIEAAAQVISVESGHFPGFAREVDPADIADAVRAEASAGRGWVKVIGDWPRKGVGPVANFDESQLRQAVAAAEGSGARVAIHTMARDVPSIAVSAGVHSIEHGLFLTDDDLAALGARGGMWVPTLLRAEALIAQLGAASSGGRLFAEGLANVRSLLPAAVEAGIRVLAGTDLVGSPANVAAEAIRLGNYGLSNRQVVESVSRHGFVVTGRDPHFAVGAPADAVFFEEDPVSDLEVLASPSMVMRLGRRL